MKLFWIIITILALQRIIELLIARSNEKFARSNGAKEYDANGYKFIVIMHIAFFISLTLEFILLSKTVNPFWGPLLVLIILAQVLRYWAIGSLGRFWNTKILIMPNTKPVNSGPYKYMSHPNYLAVVIEIALIPLIFSCYITAIVFTILNALILRRRIRIEEKALSTLN